jgi:hypothetical protein
MKRAKVFDVPQLTKAFIRGKVGDKFFVEQSDNKRVYSCATHAGRQISMRKFRDGFKATILE